MTLFDRILHLIPGEVLESLYYSKFGAIFVSMYEHFNKNEDLKVHKIFGDLLMELDLSKPVERAIPFNAYEPAITKRFLNTLKEGDVVFDVGAWIGYHTLLAARKAKTVVAIEPDVMNRQRLKINLDLNSFSNVIVLNVAVGSRSSAGVILKGPISPMNRVLQEGIGNTVKIESLDHIINELQISEINLLIMDIQGYEYFALQGLQSSLSAKIIKNLICEIHPRELSENGLTDNNIIDLLSRHGYEVSILQKNTSSENSVYYIHAT